jgi:class 3 adenylate cyclase
MKHEQLLRELARRSREDIDDIARWRDTGLITEEISAPAVERVRLVGALQRHGIDLDRIAVLFRENYELIEYFTSEVAAEPEACADALPDIELDSDIARILTARSLDGAIDAPTRADVAALQRMRRAIEGGFPEAALVQLANVYSEAMDRVADAETRLFHLHVHEPLRAQGLRGRALLDATATIRDGLTDLIEPTLMYFHGKAWQRAIRRDFLIHALEELGIETPDVTRGELTRAVLFVDLSSFTPLTSAMGDMTATTILDRFSTLARAIAHRYDGTVVKQIGDGFLVVFLDAPSAVRAAGELHRQLCEEPQFPAMHAGIHYGPVLYREGDYFGGTVNIAARLLTHADRHEIVLTAAARRRAGELDEISFHPLGMHDIKGLDEPFELYRADRAESTPNPHRTDPVCGMQLRDDEIAARMMVGDEEHVFCSTHCLQIYATRTSAPA